MAQQITDSNGNPIGKWYDPSGSGAYLNYDPDAAATPTPAGDWWTNAPYINGTPYKLNPNTGQPELIGMARIPAYTGANGQQIYRGEQVPESVARTLGASFVPYTEEQFRAPKNGFDIGGALLGLGATAMTGLGGASSLANLFGGGLLGNAGSSALISGLTGGNPVVGALTSLGTSGLTQLANAGTSAIPGASFANEIAGNMGNNPLALQAAEEALGTAPGAASMWNPFAKQAAEEAAGTAPGVGSFFNPLAQQAAQEATVPVSASIPGVTPTASSGTYSTAGMPSSTAKNVVKAAGVGAAANGGFGSDPNPVTGNDSTTPTGSGTSMSGSLSSLLPSLFGQGGALNALGGLPTSALGALLGVGLGSQSGAQQSGTTTVVNDIPEWQKPYVTNLFNQAGQTYNNAVANQSQNTDLLNAGAKLLGNTINGNYLSPDSNPYLKGMFGAASDQVTNKVNSQFSAAGRYGSGAHTGELGYQLGTLANNFYGTQYNNERARQAAAGAAAPGYATDATNSAFAPLNAYGNIVGQRFGSTQTTPYYTNPVGGALSGALAGYGLSKAFG